MVSPSTVTVDVVEALLQGKLKVDPPVSVVEPGRGGVTVMMLVPQVMVVGCVTKGSVNTSPPGRVVTVGVNVLVPVGTEPGGVVGRLVGGVVVGVAVGGVMVKVVLLAVMVVGAVIPPDSVKVLPPGSKAMDEGGDTVSVVPPVAIVVTSDTLGNTKVSELGSVTDDGGAGRMIGCVRLASGVSVG